MVTVISSTYLQVRITRKWGVNTKVKNPLIYRIEYDIFKNTFMLSIHLNVRTLISNGFEFFSLSKRTDKELDTDLR